jgi:hypothetical protein
MKVGGKYRTLLILSLFSTISVALLGCSGGGSGGGAVPEIPSIAGTFGSPVTFATHTALVSYGFSYYGPSDGQFGAIPASGMTYTFYGSAACSSTNKGEFSFTGTLDQVTDGNCTNLFGPGGPGGNPTGWIFDADYAGGGLPIA